MLSKNAATAIPTTQADIDSLDTRNFCLKYDVTGADPNNWLPSWKNLVTAGGQDFLNEMKNLMTERQWCS